MFDRSRDNSIYSLKLRSVSPISEEPTPSTPATTALDVPSPASPLPKAVPSKSTPTAALMMKREVVAAPSSNKKARPAVPVFAPPAANGEPANKKAKAESPALMACKVEISKASAVKSGRLPATPQNQTLDSATAKTALPPPPKPPHPLPPTAPIAPPLQIKAPPPPAPKAPPNAYANLPPPPKAVNPAAPPTTKADVVAVKPTLSQKAAALRQRPPRPSTKVEPLEQPVESAPAPLTKVPPLQKAPPPTPPPSATEAPTEAGLQDSAYDALVRLEDYVRTRVSKMDDEEVKRKIEKCKQHPAFGEFEKYRMTEFGLGSLDELPPFGENDMDEELICFVCWAENPANPATASPDPDPSETAAAAVVAGPSPKAATPSPKNTAPTVAAASASHQESNMGTPPTATPKIASPSPPPAAAPTSTPSPKANQPTQSSPPATPKNASPSSPPALAPTPTPSPKANQPSPPANPTPTLPNIKTKLHQFNLPNFVNSTPVPTPKQSTAPPPPPASLANQIHVASPVSELQLEYLEVTLRNMCRKYLIYI